MSNGNDEWARVMSELMAVVAARRSADVRESYTARLLAGAEDSALKKVVEEAGEVALAAKGGDKSQLANELADLFFHCFVVMVRYNITLDDVAGVLAKRRGTSGIAEKNSRTQHPEQTGEKGEA